MPSTPWSENEINATVSDYFDLLAANDRGDSVNKTEIYRHLAEKHPRRSVKAFELKFQNISAILYQQNLPYCDGLKPRFNYQRLLKLLVLDHLDRSPLPAQEAHEILFRKLAELQRRGYLPVAGKGSGRFGLTLEHHLGIPPNSDKAADFMGIELKTKHDKSLQTLFSRVPTRYTGCQDKRDLLARYGRDDLKKNRRALYTSFCSEPNTLGFSLEATSGSIRVVNGGEGVLEYDTETIEAALLSKHSQTAYVSLDTRRRDGKEQCRVGSVLYCKWPSIIRFLKLIESGDVFLDFTLSMSGNRVKDHGFLWRIRTSSLQDLYLSSAEQDLGTQ
jgi:hypothetical protein